MAYWELPIVAAIDDESQQLVVKARKNGTGDTDYLIELEIHTTALPIPQVTASNLVEFGINPGMMLQFNEMLSTIRQAPLVKAGYTEVP